MQVEKRHIFLHLNFYGHPSTGLASAPFQSVFWTKKRVFERGTLKNQTCTPSSLVRHEKLTPYANFHALPQKRRVLFFYSFKRLDYPLSRVYWQFAIIFQLVKGGSLMFLSETIMQRTFGHHLAAIFFPLFL